MPIAEALANCIRALNDIHLRGYEDLKRMIAVIDTLRSIMGALDKQKEEQKHADDHPDGEEA